MGRTQRNHPKFRKPDQSGVWACPPDKTHDFYRNKGFTDKTAPSGGFGAAQGHDYTLKLRKGESIEECQRQFRKRPVAPCPCCFQRHGRAWMLNGKGDKSFKKNKGMRKEQTRSLWHWDD